MALLGTGVASADPYPPVNPTQSNNPVCSTAPNGNGGVVIGGRNNGACNIDDQQRNRSDNSKQTRTANTGFATLTASVIALALLGGGVALVVAGRRRRHS
ncbi:hypothetical protein [Jatrophihabitans fulvus]